MKRWVKSSMVLPQLFPLLALTDMSGDGLRAFEQPLIPAAILAVPAQGRGQRSRSVSCCQLSNLGHFSVLNGVCGGDCWGKTGFTKAVDFLSHPF